MTQRRVLVIDDDEAIREIAQASLEAVGGWNVTTACDGTQGYQQAARQRPDAILLDVMMPGLDVINGNRNRGFSVHNDTTPL